MAEGTPKVTEITMVGLGDKKRRPLLLARTSDHELLLYEVFPYYEKLDKKQLKLRFKKVNHGLLLRDRKSK
jgi:cleavage and polyadenylation specificity factor subunit 1